MCASGLATASAMTRRSHEIPRSQRLGNDVDSDQQREKARDVVECEERRLFWLA
jgi:hypothetical protein